MTSPLPEGQKETSKEVLPASPSGAQVPAETDKTRGKIEDALEVQQPTPIENEARFIADDLQQGVISPNEAVALLAAALGTKGFPITRQNLKYIGIDGENEQFTLSHEDFERVPVMDFIHANSQQVVSIEDGDVHDDYGLPMSASEVGDKMKGKLVQDPEKGFCLFTPDKRLYPFNAESLASFGAHGGAAAFLNKEIVVEMRINDYFRMFYVPPELPKE